MPNELQKKGAQSSKPVRYGTLWNNRMSTGIWTQRSPLRDAATTRIVEEFYGANGDALIDGSNTEISTKLTLIRRPGSSVYNSQTFPTINRFCEFPLFNANTESIKVVADTASTVYDATGPSTKTAVFNKSAGAGTTYFQPVGNTLYFSDGPDQKKWIESALSWTANTLYDGQATSDTNFGDYIIDSNNNIQVAVGGFNAVVTEVEVENNVLTLTLDNAGLISPGIPSGGVGTSGSLATGTYYARVSAVDQNGNVTDAGTESAATAVTGPNGSIAWSWVAVSGAVGYQIYVGTASGAEASYFLAPVNSFVQTSYPGTYAGSPPSVNSTTAEFPSDLYRMENVQLYLSNFDSATFLNGQTITITDILPGGLSSTQITASFTHSNYGPSPDGGLASSGTGISGNTQPTWSKVLNAVTQDGGAQWVNRGYYVQNWGITSPSVAPTLSQTSFPSTYPSWQPNTFYWPSNIIVVMIGSAYYLFRLLNNGMTGSPSLNSWNTGSIGATTTESGVLGAIATISPDAAGTAYTVGDTVTVVYSGASGGTAKVTSISGGGGTGPVTGLTLLTAGTLYPSGGTGLSTTGGTGSGLTVNITTNPTAVVWSYEGPALWQASTFYSKGSYVSFQDPSSGFFYGYKAENAGTSGSSEPSWNESYGTETPDNAINWICVGGLPVYSDFADYSPTTSRNILTPNCLLSLNNTILDSNGFLQQAQDFGGISGTSSPAWSQILSGLTAEYWSSGITAWSYNGTTGTATFTGINSFIYNGFEGNDLTISGLSAGAFLNGNRYLSNIGLTSSSFQTEVASGTGSSSATENGTAVVNTRLIWSNIGPYNSSSTGAWKYVFAYQNSVDGSVSTASPISSSVTLGKGNQIVIQGFGSSDPQVDTINIYRTTQGGATYFLLDQIANPGGGVLWTYYDQNPDTSLNELIEAAIADQNNPPPANIGALTYHLTRIWGAVDNAVYYSNYPLETTGNALTAWNPENVFVFPAAVTRMWPSTNGLLVFTISDVYIIQGLGTQASPFFSTPFLKGIGLRSYDAFAVNGAIVYLYTSDNLLLSLDPNAGVSEIGFPIGDQFGPGNAFNCFTSHLTYNFSGSQEKALYVSDFSGDWWRMLPTPSPETGTTWCPKATIVGGFSAVQSVETSPGTHNLLIAPLTSGPILKRNSSVWTDNGSAYSAYATFGSIVLAQPGQLAGPESITTDCVAIGSPITLAVQLDEIAPASSGYFETLSLSVPDPTQLAPSNSLYAQRFYLSQTQDPAVCRHMQVQVNFGSDTVKNELLSISIFGFFEQEK